MSDLENRKIARKIARNNAHRALLRIRKELQILIENGPKTGHDPAITQVVVSQCRASIDNVAYYMYDINPGELT